MQCSAKTKSGKRCEKKALANAAFCGVHSKLAAGGRSGFEFDVFLSYSRKDKKTVHALAERLKKDGLRVWLDAWVIRPGEMIGLAIQHGVEKSRTLLMCMSPAYFESEWGKLEHHSMLFRDPTNAQRRFIPLLLQDCAPPDIIARFAHIDWRTSSDVAYEMLLAACRLDKPETEKPSAPDPNAARYTNAKVVLVGESGVGKSGLAMRLCEDRWEATESTHGMVARRLELPSVPGLEEESGLEREVWLWDFAGQPDYRLIHQLYMDETALGVLVFDPQDDNPFENIGYWDKALSSATKHDPAKLLVAGRCDRGGIMISRQKFDRVVQEQGFSDFLITGAKTGEGCEELKAAIAKHIPWERLPWTTTSRLFKTLKDAVFRFMGEDAPLVRLSELHQRLQLSLPNQAIEDSELRAVVGLMQS